MATSRKTSNWWTVWGLLILAWAAFPWLLRIVGRACRKRPRLMIRFAICHALARDKGAYCTACGKTAGSIPCNSQRR